MAQWTPNRRRNAARVERRNPNSINPEVRGHHSCSYPIRSRALAVIVAFDLDDTLYRELDYVESGFRAVAEHVADIHPITSVEAYELLMESMVRSGRGRQFDDLLRIENILVFQEFRFNITLKFISQSITEPVTDRNSKASL